MRSSIHLPSFVHRYTDKNRKMLLITYPTFETFEQGYEMDDNTLEAFFNYADEKNEQLAGKRSISTGLKKRIKFLIKAALARQLYSDIEYYQILHQEDEMIERAIEEVKQAF